MASDPGAQRADDIPEPDLIFAEVGAVLTRLAGDSLRLGVALSGGGDSTALLHLAKAWAGARVLKAATVDHGLRPESAAEARAAHDAAEALSVPHETLLWQRKSCTGNLMAAAREARLHLLADWARRQDLDAVLLGHTLDDQAETLLMRLARGAGVDGLAGMPEEREAEGMRWLRPMLGVSRAALRDWLTGRGIDWAEDPSNQNDDYERVRLRKALAVLDLPARQLAQTCANMAMAREALQESAAQVAAGAEAAHGTLRLPLAAFQHAPLEIRRRMLLAGLRFVSGAAYPPRRGPVLQLLAGLADAPRATLDGVIVAPRGDWLHLYREPAAARTVAAPDAGGVALWDGRWRVSGVRPGQVVGALGYAPLPDLNWRVSGLLRDEAAASPAIWQNGALVCAPLLKRGVEVGAKPLRGLSDFRALLHTH